MYGQYFGLKHEPFSIAPDPRYLFMSERHREALAHLLYGVKGGGGGFVLLTGEVGAGKTTVCRCLLEQIPKRCNVAYIFNPKLTVLELLQTVCEEFHVPVAPRVPGSVPTVKDYLDPFNRFLLDTHAVGLNNVLIIDEAQNLAPDVIEQLRLLTNLETNERKLLQIVLIGQPELRTMLRRPDMEQVAQRVIARYHLDALTEDETAQYLRHRLAVAGLTSALPFTARAMQHIHRVAGGVPRRINLVADRALLGAYAEGAAVADHRIVDKAAAEVFGEQRLGSRLRWPPSTLRPFAASRSRAGTAGDRASRRRAAQPEAASAPPWGIAMGGLAVGLVLAALYAFWPSRAGDAVAARAPAPGASAASAAASAAATAAAASAASAVTASASAATVGDGAPPPAMAASAPSFLTAGDVGARATMRNETDAWRELAPQWGIALPDGTPDPCALAQRAQWHCWRTPTAGLPLVRQLDRPGFITLRDDKGKPAFALLLSMTPRSATLRLGRDTVEVTLVSLAEVWQGDFATFWRAPDGYGAPLTPGMKGPVVDALAAQLAVARGDKPPTGPASFDGALRARLVAFQTAQGLTPDGRAGATTFMQLSRAAGSGQHEPRLLH